MAPLVALLGPFFLASGTFGASGRFLLPMIHYPRGSRPSSIDSPRNGAYWHYADLRPRSPGRGLLFLRRGTLRTATVSTEAADNQLRRVNRQRPEERLRGVGGLLNRFQTQRLVPGSQVFLPLLRERNWSPTPSGPIRSLWRSPCACEPAMMAHRTLV